MLEIGDIIFLVHKHNETWKDKIVHNLIRWATGSQFVHVSYYVGNNQLFEVTPFNKITYGKLDAYKEYKVKRLKLPYEQRKQIMYHIFSSQSSEYGWGEVLAILLRKKFGIPIFYDDPNRYICSEELSKAMLKLGYVMFPEHSTGDITPQELYDSEWLEDVIV